MSSKEVTRDDFPPKFLFGVASSSYQVEGARDTGKFENIWDVFTHQSPSKIIDGSNGDEAVDQYHHFLEDVRIMSSLGFKAYRFSLSWSRILPDGLVSKLNDDGIAYYQNLIKAIRDHDMLPVVTLYHWDLPSILEQKYKGFLGEEFVNDFAIYADTCFEKLGHDVKHWITFNEPINTVLKGYGTGQHAPGRSEHYRTEPYIAAHNLLKAHAKAFSIYKNKYKASQGGEIGISPNLEWAEPYSQSDLMDVKATNRFLQFQIGWFLDPIFFGDYPAVMRERLLDRLPKFTASEKELLKNSVDFVGINQYTARYVEYKFDPGFIDPTGLYPNFFYREAEIALDVKNSEGKDIGKQTDLEWLYSVPSGMRKSINYVKETYNNPSIYITENGMGYKTISHSREIKLHDQERVDYYKAYLAEVAKAVKDGADVKGYFAWSYCDNFEWNMGYTARFGLVFIDYMDGKLSRHIKDSAKWFSHFLKPGENKSSEDNVKPSIGF